MKKRQRFLFPDSRVGAVVAFPNKAIKGTKEVPTWKQKRGIYVPIVPEYDENRIQTNFLVWLFLYAGEGHSFLLNASDYLWYNILINMG